LGQIYDKTAGINRPDTAFIYMETGTVFVIDTAVPLTHTLPQIEEDKITKCEKFALEIKICGGLTMYLHTT
jgi:hypothetical protein